MKAKITSIAAILIAGLIMGGQLVSAQTYEETRPFRAKRIVSKILERAGFGEGIDETTEAGQNMYLRVYKRLREDVNTSTSKRVANELGLTTGEVEKFASGDIKGLIAQMESSCQCKVTRDQALAFIDNMQSFMNDARQDEIMAAEVQEQVKASEIYANGDTGDSGDSGSDGSTSSSGGCSLVRAIP